MIRFSNRFNPCERLTASSLTSWKAWTPLRKLSPSTSPISPGEKWAQSSSASVLAISGGSLSFAPLGAGQLIDGAVIADTAQDGLPTALAADAVRPTARTAANTRNMR